MPATARERVAAGVLVGAAVLFVGFAVPRIAVAGLLGALTLPMVLLAADVVIAAAVVTWWYPLRPVAQGLAVFGMLVHALVTLRGGPVWTRGCSGLLLIVHSWALVHLFLMTAAEDDDLDGPGDTGAKDTGAKDTGAKDIPARPDGWAHHVPYAASAEIVETPVTEVVDVVVPPEEHEHEERIR